VDPLVRSRRAADAPMASPRLLTAVTGAVVLAAVAAAAAVLTLR